MSYTVIIDEQERKREFENRINAVMRHCRIGKVSPKPPKHWVSKIPPMKSTAPPMKPIGWFPGCGAPHPYFTPRRDFGSGSDIGI